MMIRIVQAIAIESLCCRKEYGNSGGVRPKGDIEDDPISPLVVVVSIMACQKAAPFHRIVNSATLVQSDEKRIGHARQKL